MATFENLNYLIRVSFFTSDIIAAQKSWHFDAAFYGCNYLTEITLPSTMERYQAAPYWSEFFNMAEYDAPSGNLTISADEANGLRKVVRNEQVIILRGDKEYNVMGQAL